VISLGELDVTEPETRVPSRIITVACGRSASLVEAHEPSPKPNAVTASTPSIRNLIKFVPSSGSVRKNKD
jgi:hypothetical protein